MVAKSIAKFFTNIHKPTDYYSCLKCLNILIENRRYDNNNDFSRQYT